MGCQLSNDLESSVQNSDPDCRKEVIDLDKPITKSSKTVKKLIEESIDETQAEITPRFYSKFKPYY